MQTTLPPLHQHTPLLMHRPLSQKLGKSVWLKMESSQPSASFKLRGIGLMCQRAVAAGMQHLICPSGGNAGFAAAVAGAALEVKTTILVPETTSENVREAIRSIGAELMVIGQTWDEANQVAIKMSQADGAVYVPPFDHPDIWDGNATLIDELAKKIEFDVVICSVGGGGLLSGVVQGLQRNGLSNVPVIAVETEGAASLNASIKAGKLVTLSQINTTATSLGAKRVAQHAFDLTHEHEIISVTVTDKQALDACVQFADDLRTLVEPACGAALAVGYQQLDVLDKFKCPLFVVCGGIAVDLDKLVAWKQNDE
jgi:L-serine/L-threonine ammonia-lyase